MSRKVGRESPGRSLVFKAMALNEIPRGRGKGRPRPEAWNIRVTRQGTKWRNKG